MIVIFNSQACLAWCLVSDNTQQKMPSEQHRTKVTFHGTFP